MKAVFLVILIVVCEVISDPSCPNYCECKWRNGLHTADCTERNITRVPVTSYTMQAIIMDRNNLTQLVPFEFYNANWAEVRKISLRYCHLSSFNKTVFSGLSNLHHLDLSHNQLTSLGSDQLPSLPSLRTLDLSNNHLVSIHRDSFSGLGVTMKRVDLSGNSLTSLSWVIFSHLPSLKVLDLERNPWHCGCSLGFLHSELTKRNISPGDPSCSTPRHLSNKAWSSLAPAEFTCKPTVSLPQHPPVLPGQDVPLHCQVAGYPTPAISWKKDGQLIPDGSSKAHSIGVSQLDDNSLDLISVLTIMNITSTSLGLYSCLATNLEGSDEKDLLLTFPSSDTNAVVSDRKSLITIIMISAGTTILVIIFLALIIAFCMKKFLNLKLRSKSSKFQNTTMSSSTLPVMTRKPSTRTSANVSASLSRSSIQRSYLLSDTYEEDLSVSSGDKYLLDEIDGIYEQAGSACHSVGCADNIEQFPHINNTQGSRVSIHPSNTMVDPKPYRSIRHSTSYTPSHHPRPGYVTLPRRPKERPALYLEDGLGPRTSADGSSRNNISIKSEDIITNPLLFSPFSSINTIGLPLLGITSGEARFLARASTPNTSISSERGHLDTIAEQV